MKDLHQLAKEHSGPSMDCLLLDQETIDQEAGDLESGWIQLHNITLNSRQIERLLDMLYDCTYHEISHYPGQALGPYYWDMHNCISAQLTATNFLLQGSV